MWHRPPYVPLDESPGSKRGQCYVSASAGRMPNMGQQVLNIQTDEGIDTTVLYQIAEVSRPLTSVSATCDRGNWVVYTPQANLYSTAKLGSARASSARAASTSSTSGCETKTIAGVILPRVFPSRVTERSGPWEGERSPSQESFPCQTGT